MRVFVGGMPMTFPARWYFAPDGAELLASPHGCESSVWLDNWAINYEWGEVTPWPKDPESDALKTPDKGVNPGYTGHAQLGADQWFVDGQLPADVLDGPPPPMCPSCQALQPYVGAGGLVIGGGAVVLAPCNLCLPGTQPARGYTLTAVGGTGDYAAANGQFTLVQTAATNACFWSTPAGVLPSWSYSLIPGILFGQIAVFELAPGRLANWSQAFGAQADCGATISPSFAFGFGLLGTPPTITIAPR